MFQALLLALLTTLLLVSVTATNSRDISEAISDQDSSDIINNLVEPQEQSSVASSRSFHEPHKSRLNQESAPTDNSASVQKKPQPRTLSIPSFLGGEQETKDDQAASASSIGDIAPLNDHPLWKVHKYQGIDLTPVPLPTAYGPPSESYGSPAETYGPPEPSNPSEPYGPPRGTYGPPESSGSATGDSSDALSALDNLSGLANLLPGSGSSSSSSTSALSSLASLLNHKSNSASSTGLNLEQLSALASLVSFLQAKSNGETESAYGQPSLTPNIHGTDLSALASLVNLFPSETASSSGTLLTRLRSLLTRRPAFLTRLLNALNLVNPSKPKGAFPRFLKHNIVHPLPVTKDSSTFPVQYNTVAKFTENTGEIQARPLGEIAKHVLLEKLPSKSGKLGKLGAIKGHPPLKLVTALNGHTLSKLRKLGEIEIIKSKVPLKVGTVSKPTILKAISGLGKIGKHGIIKAHFPLKARLVSKFTALKNHDVSLFGKDHLRMKAAILSTPFKIKNHFVSKLGKFGKIGIPFKLGTLGKSAVSKLRKFVKLGVIKTYIPLKLLGKYAAIKNHFISKLLKLSTGAKHIKFGILAAPIVAKKHITSKLKTLGKSIQTIKSSLPSKYDILSAPIKLNSHLISKLKASGKSSVIEHSDLKWGILNKPVGIKGLLEFKTAKLRFPFFSKADERSNAEISRKDDQIGKDKNIRESDKYILNHIPNSFLGTVPEAEVANLLDLPDLPPISIPANYKFQEAGVRSPYVVKYTKPAPPTVPDNAYGPPPHEVEASAQPQQGVSLYPPSHVSSTYDTLIQPPQTYGLAKDMTSFQPSDSLSQQSFDSFHSPIVLYPSSIQESRSPVNSYGQPTSPYSAVSSETNPVNPGFQTEPQNQFYNQGIQTPATDTAVSQNVYSVPQRSNVQSEVAGTTSEFDSYQVAQSGPYPPQQSHLPSHSGPYPGTSRSDTDIPSENVTSKRRDDFRPSTLAAATGAGYSTVAFQGSQQDVFHDLEQERRQPEVQLDLVATSTFNVPQNVGWSTPPVDRVSVESSEDPQLRK